MTGYGVCEREISQVTVGQIGRVAEKWRYDVEDSICARKSALSEGQNKRSIFSSQRKSSDVSLVANDLGFDTSPKVQDPRIFYRLVSHFYPGCLR